MQRVSQDGAQNEEGPGQNENSSSSIPTNKMANPSTSPKSHLRKEVESLGTQSLETSAGSDAPEPHMTRQRTRMLQGIPEKASIFDAKRGDHSFLKPDDFNQLNPGSSDKSKTMIDSEIIVVQSDPPNRAAARNIVLRKRAEGLIKWEMWQQRKEKITKALQSQYYDITSLVTENLLIGIHDDLENYNLTIQDGLHVFRPTADVLNDFENFLQRAENLAGRETGVVKVILPKELILPPDNGNEFVIQGTESHGQKAWTPSIENRLVVKYLTKLETRLSELNGLPIYDVHMMGGLRQSACTCSEDVRSHRRSVLELHGKNENYPGDIFSAVKFADDCEEEKMVECGGHSSTDCYYSADIDASTQSRSALNCGKLHMKEFHSYGFCGAQTDKDEIHQPKLQVAGAFGSSFGLQMTSFGGYSLNVLHSGAPKCWTVIKPADHRKIELELHPEAEEASLRGRRIKFVRLTSIDVDNPSKKNRKKKQKVECPPPADIPPRCDQFLNHQPFYIPKASLEAYGVEFVQLAQYEGELIIRFPFAYSQGYSCGPSIAEEVGYTNERSEVFNQEGLYYHCHAACSGPKPPIDFGAFPTAAASDARRIEKTITPMPLDNFISRANRPTASLAMAMDESAIGDDEILSKNQGNQEAKKDDIRRKRLVTASELPEYKE